MTTEALTSPAKPDVHLFQDLYTRFGKDLVEARQFIAAECTNPEMRRQFDDLEAEALYLLLRATNPQTVVEISPCDGWSTTWILQALADNKTGNLDSFDIHDNSTRFVPKVLTDRWNLHVGDVRSADVTIPESIDFLLIDSKHTQGFAKWYLDEVLPKVTPGSPIVIHDIESGLPMPGIPDTWTGVNLIGTEGWRVQKMLRQKQIGYYTLCNTLRSPSGFINQNLAQLARTGAGITNNFSGHTRNPAIFFFQTT
jgi:predicted O-methyltransferase YrrM